MIFRIFLLRPFQCFAVSRYRLISFVTQTFKRTLKCLKNRKTTKLRKQTRVAPVHAVVAAAHRQIVAIPEMTIRINRVVDMSQKPSRPTTEQIWQQLSFQLRQFVRSRISSEADVDDVLQNVFLRIHKSLDSIRKDDRLKSWVFQIARNAIADHFRSVSKPLADNGSQLGHQEMIAASLNTEIGNCLRALISQLPDDQKNALLMHEFQGLKQNEIAERESISLSGAKSRIQRGRKSLEAMLRACCEFQFDVRGNVVEFEPNEGNCCDGKCE